MPRVVLHVDMDAFFAALHEREDPALARVPLVVGADPRAGQGRGVVVTANYAARAFGIRSAMPIGEAYRRCPHATFVAPRRGLYRPASDEVMRILARYADAADTTDTTGSVDPMRDEAPRAATRCEGGAGSMLQVAGLDEAYLDVTRCCAGDAAQAHNLARSLQAAIRRETGLSCSIGIGPSKSTAKIASDHRKPHGITLVAPDRVEDFLDPLRVGLINGCGPKTAAKLAEWDIRTIGDLARADRELIAARFGSHGLWLHDIARGIDDRPVVPDQGPPKSRGNERTYLRDEASASKVHDAARRLLDSLLDARDRRAFATVCIKLRYADFTTLTRSHTLSIPLDPAHAETRALAGATVQALLGPLLGGRSVRLVGVRLSGFRDATGQRVLTDFRACADHSIWRQRASTI